MTHALPFTKHRVKLLQRIFRAVARQQAKTNEIASELVSFWDLAVDADDINVENPRLAHGTSRTLSRLPKSPSTEFYPANLNSRARWPETGPRSRSLLPM
jgi:hypothetical protein